MKIEGLIEMLERLDDERADLEARDNWQATFRITGNGKLDCLMRTADGRSFYMHQPDYNGLFTWGATCTANLDWLRQDVADGHLKLIAGTIPQKDVHND